MPANNVAPSSLQSLESRESNRMYRETPNIMGISRLIIDLLLVSGLNMADMPRIKEILNILLPITFPTAIMLFPFTEETRLTTNSGVDVPKATTVRPMTTGVTPRLLARLDDPLTSHSAP